MKTVTYKITFAITLVLTLIGMSADICVAEVGYNARLENPPSFVSPYFAPPTRFSISLPSSSYAPLSRGWEHSPTVVNSSSDSLSLRFNTVYYGRGTAAKKLIPVSVDAVPYSKKQRERLLLSKMKASSAQRLNAPERGRGRRGLGITVPLPKRLDNIFGEGGAGLRVSGFRRITLSGRSQWTDAADNDLYRQNKFPSLAMEQVSKFDIGGTIGSKITVKVAQDNQTDIPLANRLQIRYKGDEDDILKTIEAGNTTLSLPNTKFVGYSSSIRGLFGIKVAAQLGGLKFTAIASQEKGSTEKATFSASGEEEATFIRDYDYVQGRIFDLGIPSDTLGDTTRALRPNDRIVRLLIYESENNAGVVLEARDANLYVNPTYTSLYSAEKVENNKVMKLDETTQFTFQQDASKNLHYVVFASSRTSNKDLGYYMEIERDGQIIKYGDITSDTLNLTLLYRADASPNQQTWDLMWRNCYKVPRGVDVEDVGLKVFKGLNGTERRTTNLDSQQPDGGIYLEILGLDQYKNGSLNDKLPDGLVDDRDDIFRKEWGLVIFPHRRPFASDTTFTDKGNVSTAPLAEQVPSIYDYVSITEKSDNSQYYLMLSTRTRSSIIRLKKANIIEGSEKVMLNGHQLIRDQDYTIQYDFGQITLLTSGANDPNADISVDYEFAPFFAVQKKTLLGVRAEYEWSENFQFGTTVLYKSDKAQERKPRVGQETAEMMVLDFDASLALKPRILTTLANALPFVTTDRPSNLKISGEIAQSRPNPNVDGVAYVDDFESAIEDLSLSTSRVTWQKSSRPLHADLSLQRGRTLWHAPRDVVQVSDVYDRQTAQGEGSLRTMRMVFRPNVKDTVLSEDSLSIVTIDDLVRPTWAGIMRYFGSRVDAKRAQLFEMRARTSENFQGRLHFDFGRISEDANGNGIPDSEDEYPEDGAASTEEDVGIFDGVPDHMEPLYDDATNTDPNGDNWYFLGAGDCPFPENECNQFENEQRWNNNDSLYYEWLNGTEGNRVDVSVLGLPDEEALSSGGSELNDAYFSFYIDFNDPTDPFYCDSLAVEGTEKDSKLGDRIEGPWRTYRIPIRDSSIASTFISNEDLNPEWSQIKHVRVWWESSSGQTVTDTLEVANWYFVQSNWQDSVIYSPLSNQSADDATSLVVASISEDENSDFKSTPAEPYRDPTSNVTEPRRGLMLEYKNLHKGDTCIATKDLMVVDRYSGYRRIEMYAYSDLEEADAEKVKLFFRLGRDEENFYEQQIIVKPTVPLVWDEANYISIDFNEITALKDEMLKADATEISRDGYRVKGNPNISEVRYFAIGLINEDTDSIPSLQSGQIWLDELRVTDVRRDVGMAGRLSVSGTMADLATFNFNYQSQDPYFRGLSTATRGGGDSNLGSGKTATSFSFSSTISLDKFFSRSWGVRLPVTIGRTRSVTTPLLRTNSDIVLPEAVRKAEESISESSNFQVSESFAKKDGNLLFSVLLNRLTTSFSYRRNLSRSVTRPYNFGENYNINSGFNFGIKKTPSLPVFFWTKPIPILKKLAGSKLSLYPSSWQTKATYTRTLTVSDDVNHVRRASLVRSFSGNMDVTYKVFPNLTTTYKYSTRRDLSEPGMVRFSLKDFKLGLETNYNQSFTANYNPNLLTFLTSTLVYSASYRDDFNRSSQTRQSTLSTNSGVSGVFNHTILLGKGGSQKRGQSKSRRPYEGRHRDQQKRGNAVDSLETKKEENKGDGTPFYAYPTKLLRLLTGWIRPVSYRYNQTFTKAVPGIGERPSWKYRFGLTTDPEVEIVDETRFPNASEGFSYDLSSGFKLLGGIDTKVKFKQTIRRSLISQGARHEDISTSWPDLTIRIQKFKQFPLFKGVLNKFIDVFAPRTGYSRQTKEARNRDDDFTTSKSVAVNHNPLLSINFKVMRALSLSASYTMSKNRDETYNPTTGVMESIKKSQRRGIALATKYSFSAPGGISIPLFGKLKFKSTMNIELNLKLNSTLSEVAKTGGAFATSSDKSELSIIPVVTYMFSQQIKGGLSARWQDTSDNKMGRKSHVRELRIWAELRF